MKRIIAIALLATATLMTAGSANAQSAVLKVNVPFSFTVGNTFLPAGNYAVGFDSIHPNRLIIEDRTKTVRATAYVQRGLIGRGMEDRLIFHRYGGEYFLSEVGFDSASDGVSLPVSKLESRVRAGATEELAFLAGH
ncbi:MAG: hypothetical protein ABSE36_16455 [Terracidiphilus sp.]|jgi:hypothetical protein